MCSQGRGALTFNSSLIISTFQKTLCSCYSYYSLSFSLPSPRVLSSDKSGREKEKQAGTVVFPTNSFCWRGPQSNCPNTYLQMKTENYPGLWGITGVEVCMQACPGHCTQKRHMKARPEGALSCPSAPADSRAGENSDSDGPLPAHQKDPKARSSALPPAPLPPPSRSPPSPPHPVQRSSSKAMETKVRVRTPLRLGQSPRASSREGTDGSHSIVNGYYCQ